MNDQPIQVDVRLVEHGSIKAFADATFPIPFGEMTVKGFRVVSKNGEPLWVGFPNTTFQKNGKTTNKPLLEVRTGVQRQIADAILKAYEALLAGTRE